MAKEQQAKRAVIYLRVSSPKQVNKEIDPEGLSLPSQRKKCEAEAKRLGAEVVREYVEPGVSGGSVLKRKAFNRMLADIEKLKDVDVVVFWKVSRWARDEIDQWTAFGLLQKQGVALASASEPIDNSPTGMLVFGIMGSIAAHQRRELSVEVKRTQQQKAEVGGTPGHVPLGYLNTIIEIDGRPVRDVKLDEQRAPLVRDAFQLYATGDYSLMELAAILEARGLRFRATRKFPERPVNFKRLAEILRNPYYLGLVPYGGKIYKGRHEPLVDEGTFQEVKDLLDSKRQSRERSWRHFHYLRGSVFCGKCGGRLTYANAKGNGGTYGYLVCSGRMQSTCPQGYHRVEAVEDAIERHYVVVQLDKEHRDSIRQAVQTHVGTVAKTADEKLAEAKAELVRLSGEERKLLQAHYADQVSEELFAEEQARIRRQRHGAERRIADLSVKHERVLDALDVALGLTDSMQAAYCQAGPSERRLFNQAFFERLEISDEEVVGYRLAEPFDQLRGPKAEDGADAQALAERLGDGWNETLAPAGNGKLEPIAPVLNARTPALFSEDGGSNVEALVRPNGVEPSRPVRGTRPSTLRVYQFRHGRRGWPILDVWQRREPLPCTCPGEAVACEQVFGREGDPANGGNETTDG